MHGAIGAFLSEIPATSRFSMNFESNTLEIRVHFQMAPTENAHKEPKKKAPPSKVKRNRRRLAKFLDKPETQPDSPPSTSCEKSSEGEELVAPPLFAPFEPCIEEGEGLEFDTSSVADSGKDPPPSMQTKTSFTCKDREQGQGEMEKGKDGDKILVDNEAGRENELEEKYEQLMTQVSEKDRRNIELAKEKGAGAWLSATPIKSLGFVLNKQEFRDSICLRYGWNIPDTPAYCQCGSKNSIDHTLSCPNGGYTIMRHNGVRDLEAELMREVCRDVKVEPELLPIGEQEMAGITSDKARLDVSGVGVWGEHERTFLDIKIFHPNCQSYSNMDIEKAYVHHQNIKKHNYKERVLNVEHGSFTPVIFTTTGGVGPEANKHHKRIAQLMAIKKKGEYSQIISYIRTRLRFNLLKSILVAVRGERGRRTRAGPISAIEFGQIPLPQD